MLNGADEPAFVSIVKARASAIRNGSQFLPRDPRKRRTNNESDMECGDLSDLSPLSF